MAELLLGLAKTTVEGTVSMAKTVIEDEKQLQQGVQRGLALMSDEFEMMQSFLNDAAAKGLVSDNVTRTMVSQVRNMALDMEDCIETVVYIDDKPHFFRRFLQSTCLSAAVPAGADLDAAIADIELLRFRVEAMGQRSLRYGGLIGNSDPKTGEQKRQLPVVRVAASDLTEMEAREKEKKERKKNKQRGRRVPGLVDLIIREDAAGLLMLQVISVLGPYGTMSSIKRAYEDSQICRSFRCRAWVKMMHPFSPKKFIRSLLPQFQRNGCPPMELLNVLTEDALIEEFRNQLSKLKYLVVLEDVSTMVDWEAVRVCLPDGNNGSCIVVNTHLVEIATLCAGSPYRDIFNKDLNPPRVLELEKLSTQDSVFVVFNQAAAGKWEGTVPDKQETAREWLDEHKLLVGREMDLLWLSWFVELGCRLSVWGMSGVGKSYLVKYFYYKKHNFSEDGMFRGFSFGWVNVSHPLDLMDFARNLLSDLNPVYLQLRMMPTTKNVIQACCEYLHRYWCFIVIDGLQSTEEWDLIKAALELGTFGGSIIVITNEESVAKHCAHNDSVWNVKGLDVDNATSLLHRKVENAYNMIEDKEEVRTIVRKCGGLPKAICAAANIISFCPRSVQYSFIKDNLVSELEANARYIRESVENMLAWLLSYLSSCPDFLKPCIFYLTIFPLSYTIRRRRLVRRWIAEGYARDSKECTAEENGETSFSKLVNLSMILVPPLCGRSPPLCQVNGFLREYIISRSIEENLVFALEGSSRKSLHRTGRHLAIDKSWDRDENVFESINFSRLRSLTVFGKWEKYFISDKNKMELLRVLDLEDASDVTNAEVERMVNLLPRLKFLSLRRCPAITHLPDSLGDMKQLQTLDVRETHVIKLPKSIIKLEKLQYIRAGTTVIMDGDAGTPSPAESQSSSDNDKGNVERVPPSSPPPPVAERTSVSGDGNGVVERRTTVSSPPPAAAKCRPGAFMVPDWLSKLWGQRRLNGGSHNGVKLTRGIGNLSNLHTLGVVNISAAGKDGVLEELKKLTQLHKLAVSRINQNNIQMFFSAISGLAHLECLSLQLQIDEDNQPGCLDAISMEPMENVLSLKLYGLVSKLPVWIKGFPNVKKLSLQIAMVRQEVIDSLESVGLLGSLRLFLSEFEEDKLQFTLSGPSMVFLEISSNSRSQATIMFTEESKYPQVLRIRCGRVSPLRISGLNNLNELKEVWVSGPCDDDHKQHFYSELDKYQKRSDQGKGPVLRLEEEEEEEPGSSTPWLMTSS